MIEVVVASQMGIIREGMKRILRPHEDISVVAEVSTPEEVTAIPDKSKVLVVVHSSATGCQDIRFVRRKYPALHIIIVAPSPTLFQIQAALQNGARGFLHAGCAVNHLPDAIRAVSEGRIYLNKEISQLIATDVRQLSKDHSHHSLTQREREIFHKLAAGMKVSAIAAELAISVKTVSTHKARLMEKMGISSFTDLIQYAVANQLLDKTHGTEPAMPMDGVATEAAMYYAVSKHCGRQRS